MGKNTLHLPKKGSVDPLEAIAQDSLETPSPIAVTDEVLAEYLKSKGFTITRAMPNGRGVVADTTEHLPTAPSQPADLSKLPPPGERACAPAQVPPRVWGNPRFFKK